MAVEEKKCVISCSFVIYDRYGYAAWITQTVFLVWRFRSDSTRAFFFRSFSIKKGVSWTDGNFPCLLAVSYSICKVLLWFSFTHNNGTINSHTWNLRDFNWFMMQQSQPLQEQQDESSSRLGDVSVRICSRLRSTNERRRINRNLSFIWANLRYANICTSINSLWHKSFYYYFGIIIF